MSSYPCPSIPKSGLLPQKLLFLLLQTHLYRYGALPCYFMPLRVGQTSFGTQTTPSPPLIFWWPLQLNIKNPLFYFQKPIFSKNSLCQTQFLNKNVTLMLENHLIRSTCLTIAKSTPKMVEKRLFHPFSFKRNVEKVFLSPYKDKNHFARHNF